MTNLIEGDSCNEQDALCDSLPERWDIEQDEAVIKYLNNNETEDCPKECSATTGKTCATENNCSNNFKF